MFGENIGNMYDKISHMEPLLPTGDFGLEDMAREIVGGSAALGGHLKNNGEPGWIVLHLHGGKHESDSAEFSILGRPGQ